MVFKRMEVIDSMTRYTVTLEHDEPESFLAWVHELPGCIAHGTTRAEAEANVVQAIDRFRSWLRAVGEEISHEPVTYDVVEEAAPAEWTAEGSSGVLLTWDQGPLTPADWTPIERRLDHSRREVLQTLASMSADDLQTVSGKGARSIARQLHHLASAECMYVIWTFDLRSKEGLGELLDWTRRMVLDRMRTLAEQRDTRLTRALWSGDEHPEPWTARKAARRLIYHERWHLNSIRRLLQGFRGREASGAQP